MHTDPTRSRDWVPPHCPNPKCRHHKQVDPSWSWRRRGFFTRRCDRIRVQRFECGTCHVTFSTQTFSTTYWLKRPGLLRRLFMRLVGCMAGRQIARDLGCSPETVQRLTARLGRQCMLLHWTLWAQAPPDGPVVVDGFESFEFSQYHPVHHHLAVEAETGFFLYHTDSELRRKGRMTRRQKRRRAQLEQELGRADPGAIREDMAELLGVVLGRARRVDVRSDEHRAYPPAIRQAERESGCRVRHTVTSSKKPRTVRNPLFEVNLLDLLIRHGQSNHKRETIAFSKRRQGSAERLSVLQVWRNLVKSRWEKRPGTTPAMLKGLTKAPWTVATVLSERLFPGRIELPARWDAYYRRTVRTRAIQRNRKHELKYAY